MSETPTPSERLYLSDDVYFLKSVYKMFKQVASTSVAYDGNKQAYIVLPNLSCHSSYCQELIQVSEVSAISNISKISEKS